MKISLSVLVVGTPAWACFVANSVKRNTRTCSPSKASRSISATAVKDDAYQCSVAKLKAWYSTLDQELEAVLSTVTDADVANRKMDRDGYQVPLHISLDILREAMLKLLRQGQRLPQGDGK